MLILFNELLANVGYSPVNEDEYGGFNIEILESTFFEVTDDFPKLTSGMINGSLSNRISSVQYDISLEGMKGINLENINWGSYFY